MRENRYTVIEETYGRDGDMPFHEGDDREKAEILAEDIIRYWCSDVARPCTCGKNKSLSVKFAEGVQVLPGETEEDVAARMGWECDYWREPYITEINGVEIALKPGWEDECYFSISSDEVKKLESWNDLIFDWEV